MIRKILITGGTGLLGSAISKELEEQNFEIAYLSRSKGQFRGHQKFQWDIQSGKLEKEAIRWADAIIHLAGAGVADKKWTAARKKEILESRTKSSEILFQSLKNTDHQVKKVISASAIGFYGFGDKDKVFSEEAPPANDFLAQVTRKWEAATEQFSELNVLNVRIRIGVVLSSRGGAFQKLMQPIRFGLGAPLGSGRQMMSWIHIDDLVQMFLYFLRNDESGIFNGVAPKPVSNRQMTKATADSIGRPLILPNVPGFALKLVLGEMADIVLKGANVSSQKVENSGFRFKFPELHDAISDIVRRKV